MIIYVEVPCWPRKVAILISKNHFVQEQTIQYISRPEQPLQKTEITDVRKAKHLTQRLSSCSGCSTSISSACSGVAWHEQEFAIGGQPRPPHTLLHKSQDYPSTDAATCCCFCRSLHPTCVHSLTYCDAVSLCFFHTWQVANQCKKENIYIYNMNADTCFS